MILMWGWDYISSIFTGPQKPATVTVRVGNNRPDLGTNPVCNRFTGELEEGKPLFLPCNPPLPGAFVSVHLDGPVPTQLSLCEAFVYTDQVRIRKKITGTQIKEFVPLLET